MSWSDIESCIEILCNKIKKTGFEFDMIATISRGGLVPAQTSCGSFQYQKNIGGQKHHSKKNTFC